MSDRHIGVRTRVKTKGMNSEEFSEAFISLVSHRPATLPLLNEGEELHGEIFLTIEAFTKFLVVSADPEFRHKFVPNPEPQLGISGVYTADTHKLSVRTNAFQKSSERDYENMGAHDMELRIYV